LLLSARVAVHCGLHPRAFSHLFLCDRTRYFRRQGQPCPLELDLAASILSKKSGGAEDGIMLANAIGAPAVPSIPRQLPYYGPNIVPRQVAFARSSWSREWRGQVWSYRC